MLKCEVSIRGGPWQIIDLISYGMFLKWGLDYIKLRWTEIEQEETTKEDM